MHLSDFSVGSLGETSIVGSGPAGRHRRRARIQDAGQRPGDAVLLRRRRVQRGHVPREPEPGRDLAAAGRLPVREQRLRRAERGQRHGVGARRRPSGPPATACPASTVDGQDVVAVYEAVSEAVARARRGDGPSLVETKTYRFHNHAFGLPSIELPRPGRDRRVAQARPGRAVPRPADRRGRARRRARSRPSRTRSPRRSRPPWRSPSPARSRSRTPRSTTCSPTRSRSGR